MAALLTVLLVEDDPVWIALITGWLQEASGFLLLGSCTSLAGATAFLASKTADLMILDRQLPDGDGVAWLERLQPPFEGRVIVHGREQLVVYPGIERSVVKSGSAPDLLAALRGEAVTSDR